MSIFNRFNDLYIDEKFVLAAIAVASAILAAGIKPKTEIFITGMTPELAKEMGLT